MLLKICPKEKIKLTIVLSKFKTKEINTTTTSYLIRGKLDTKIHSLSYWVVI